MATVGVLVDPQVTPTEFGEFPESVAHHAASRTIEA
jgi:hypothetical protein